MNDHDQSTTTPHITPAESLVVAAIQSAIQQGNHAPTNASIATLISVTCRSVTRAITHLVGLGYLERIATPWGVRVLKVTELAQCLPPRQIVYPPDNYQCLPPRQDVYPLDKLSTPPLENGENLSIYKNILIGAAPDPSLPESITATVGIETRPETEFSPLRRHPLPPTTPAMMTLPESVEVSLEAQVQRPSMDDLAKHCSTAQPNVPLGYAVMVIDVASNAGWVDTNNATIRNWRAYVSKAWATKRAGWRDDVRNHEAAKRESARIAAGDDPTATPTPTGRTGEGHTSLSQQSKDYLLRCKQRQLDDQARYAAAGAMAVAAKAAAPPPVFAQDDVSTNGLTLIHPAPQNDAYGDSIANIPIDDLKRAS